MSIYNSKPIVSNIIEFSIAHCDNAFAILINGSLAYAPPGRDHTQPQSKVFTLRPGLNTASIVFSNFDGRASFEYTIRDRNGDIETVTFTPSDVGQGIYRSDVWEIYTPYENS